MAVRNGEAAVDEDVLARIGRWLNRQSSIDSRQASVVSPAR